MAYLGFWGHLKKPIHVLAPMANVTDSAFRQIIAEHGKPDVFFTEFISCDGLQSEGRHHLLPDLYFTNKEHPLVLQLFGAQPENFYKTAELAQKLGYDGIDINMGCPDRSVERQGAGAALIKNYNQAKEIISATKEGARGLPVSVKTRIGYTKDSTEEWVDILLAAGPAVITLHARTRKEMSKVPARWDSIARAVAVRDQKKSETLIIGNGDVMTLQEGESRVSQTKCDGVMYGRAIFGNPWLFKDKGETSITIDQRLNAMLAHTKKFLDVYGDVKNFAIMKKHFKAYVADFDRAKELRGELMLCESYDEICELINGYRETSSR